LIIAGFFVVMANNSESGPSDWKKRFVNMPPFDPNAMWKKIQEKKAREEEARKKKEERDEEMKMREQYAWDNLWAALKEKKKREEAKKARSAGIMKYKAQIKKEVQEEEARRKKAREEEAKKASEMTIMTQPSDARGRENAKLEEGEEKPHKLPRFTQ
jgi:hypothetical protein